MEPDIAKALVTPMPLDLPVPTPSIFAWEIGIVVVWVIILVFRRFLVRTAIGRWFLFFIPINLQLGFTGVFLLLTFLSLIPTIRFTLSTLSIEVTLLDLFVGFVWGIFFDALTILWLKVVLAVAMRKD